MVRTPLSIMRAGALAVGSLLAQGCNGAEDKDPKLPLSDIDSGPRPGTDGGIVTEGGATTTDDSAVATGADSGTIPVKCTQAEFDAADFTVRGNVSVSFSESSLPKQYTMHCVKIKAGMVVRYEGNFELHPLERAGGDTASPIPALTQTNTGGPRPTLGYLDVTFTKAGTFGYRCKTHPADMYGAVQVLP